VGGWVVPGGGGGGPVVGVGVGVGVVGGGGWGCSYKIQLDGLPSRLHRLTYLLVRAPSQGGAVHCSEVITHSNGAAPFSNTALCQLSDNVQAGTGGKHSEADAVRGVQLYSVYGPTRVVGVGRWRGGRGAEWRPQPIIAPRQRAPGDCIKELAVRVRHGVGGRRGWLQERGGGVHFAKRTYRQITMTHSVGAKA
jgi:hypothetical protein